MRTQPALAIFTLLFAISISLTGCTRGCTSRPATDGAAPSSQPAFHAGSAVFGFDYEHVSDALIVKNEPGSGDRWAARLSNDHGTWRIRSADSTRAPLDDLADGYLILHLLDTLRTLRVEQPEAAGPHASLGLAPPRLAIQWRVDGQEFELRIGAPADKAGSTVYAWVPGHEAFTARGATLQMTGYLDGFASLRLKTWAGIQADDVDEIASPEGFYAQREGDTWVDRGHKRIAADINAWLDKIAHERVSAFVDDPMEAQALRAAAQSHVLARLTLKDRHGKPVELSVSRIGARLIAMSSARPQGVFEAFAGAERALVPPRR